MLTQLPVSRSGLNLSILHAKWRTSCAVQLAFEMLSYCTKTPDLSCTTATLSKTLLVVIVALRMPCSSVIDVREDLCRFV
jgi:hypothetical protein